MNLRPRHLLPVFVLAGSISTLHAQLFWTGGSNSYITPTFRGSGANAEYSRWDGFYSPYNDVNYPDIAAPNGIKQARSAAGFAPSTVYNPTDPTAFWHVDNPTILQTGGSASGAFIVGPGTTAAPSGNIYSFAASTSFEVADTVPFTSVGTVNFQFQTDGQPINYSTLKLIYNDGNADVILDPTSQVLEYKAATSAFGFAPMVRGSVQWDLTGLDITSYRVVFDSIGSSLSFQEAVLDTSATYTEVTPVARTWSAGGGNANWSNAANWQSNAISSLGSNVTIDAGSSVVVDSARTVGELTLATPGNLTISGSSLLTVNTGIIVNTPGSHTISAPVYMGGFNVNEIVAGASLTLSGSIGNNGTASGGGFFKEGSGTLVLAGDNTFTGGIYLDGGLLRIDHNGALNSSTPNGITFLAAAAADTRVQLNGHSVTIGGLVSSTDPLGADPGVPVVENGTATNVTLNFNPTGPSTFGGILRDGGAGKLAVIKTGTSTQILAGPNTYTGGTTVTGGLLGINSDQALGATAATPGTVVLNGGGLSAVGSLILANSRALVLGPASGSGSGTLDVATAGTTLTYGGGLSNNGAGTGSLLKSGFGTLVLNGASTYTGTTTVTGGFLSVDADNRLGATPGSATAGNLVLNVGGLFASESFTLSANRGIAVGPTTSTGSGAVSVAPGKTLSYSGIIANNGGTGGLIKNGAGTLTLSGVSTYTGPTALYGGTLRLDFPTTATNSNLLSPSSQLQGLSGTLLVLGKASGLSSQTFASTTLPLGHTSITVDSNGGSGTTLALSAISRTSGATVNFTLPAAGAITTATTTVTNGVLTNLASPNGVVYATVGGSDWATLSGSNIVAVSSYQTSATPANWATTDNVALNANASGVGTASVNTLKLIGGADVAITSGQTFTLGVGGLLVTGSGASQITGGTLRGSGGTTKELVIFQNNTANDFTIGSVIANDAAATALTKTGSGTLVLSGANTFTGITRITGGTVSIATLGNGGVAGNLGQATNVAANIVIDGATLRYTGAAAASDRGFTVGINGATLDASGSGPLTISGSASFQGANTARTLILTGTNTGDNTLSGTIANNISGVNPNQTTGATSLTKTGPGTWQLSGGNSFTGGVTIAEGTLKLGDVGALNTTTPNRVTFDASAPAGTRLQLAGTSPMIGGLSSAANTAVVENASSTSATLVVNQTEDLTFAGTLRNGSGTGALALTKAGPGTLTVTGNNNYTGPTIVSGGTLDVAGLSGSLSATLSVSVTEAGTLLLSGTAADRVNNVPTTLNGGTLAFGDALYGSQETLGSLTLSGDSTIDFGSLSTGGGNQGNRFVFGDLALNGHTLSIYNWSGSSYVGIGSDSGSLLQDRLLFSSDVSAQMLAGIRFYSDEGTTPIGVGGQISFGQNFEIVPIPEPSTTGLLAAAALLGFIGFRERRQLAGLLPAANSSAR